MKTTFQQWCALIFIVSVPAIALVSCAKRPPAPPLDYPHAYKALMIRYRDTVKPLVARPLPSKSLPKEQRRAALAQQVRDVADVHADFARQLHALTPLPEFTEVHRATEDMLRVEADSNYRMADAILHKNRADRDEVAKAMDADELRAAVHLQQALKRAAGESKGLNSLVDDLRKSNASP